MLVPAAWPTSFLPQEFVAILTSCGFGSIATLAQVDEEPEEFVLLLAELLDEKIIYLTDQTVAGSKDLLDTLNQHKLLLLNQKDRFCKAFVRVKKSQKPLCELAAQAAVYWAMPRPLHQPPDVSHAAKRLKADRAAWTLTAAAGATGGELDRPLLLQGGGAGAEALATREHRQRAKAAERLKEILVRAGPHAKLANQLRAVGTAGDTLLQSVLGHGAAQTILRHVRTWNSIEDWLEDHRAKGTAISSWAMYPPAAEMVLAFITVRVTNKCGPTVPGMIKEAVMWMCKRLQIVLPDINEVAFRAIQATAIHGYREGGDSLPPQPHRIVGPTRCGRQRTGAREAGGGVYLVPDLRIPQVRRRHPCAPVLPQFHSRGAAGCLLADKA